MTYKEGKSAFVRGSFIGGDHSLLHLSAGVMGGEKGMDSAGNGQPAGCDEGGRDGPNQLRGAAA